MRDELVQAGAAEVRCEGCDEHAPLYEPSVGGGPLLCELCFLEESTEP